MKIEIAWHSSHSATLNIQGRVLRVRIMPGGTVLEGIKDPESYYTVGGQIALILFEKIGAIMQATAIAEEEISPDGSEDVTWMRMSKRLADIVEDRISF